MLSHHRPGALHHEDPDSAPEPIPPVRDAARLDLDDGAAAGEEDLVVVLGGISSAVKCPQHDQRLRPTSRAIRAIHATLSTLTARNQVARGASPKTCFDTASNHPFLTRAPKKRVARRHGGTHSRRLGTPTPPPPTHLVQSGCGPFRSQLGATLSSVSNRAARDSRQ